jgi:energy-coupling factor transporter transmembrane protein EcfT
MTGVTAGAIIGFIGATFFIAGFLAALFLAGFFFPAFFLDFLAAFFFAGFRFFAAFFFAAFFLVDLRFVLRFFAFLAFFAVFFFAAFFFVAMVKLLFNGGPKVRGRNRRPRYRAYQAFGFASNEKPGGSGSLLRALR